MTTTLTSIRTTSSAFVRKAASETGAFFIRNKKTAIITGTSVLVGAAVIAGGTIFAVNSLNTGLTIKGAPVAAATATPKVTAAPVAATSPADVAAKATAGKNVGDVLTADQAAAVSKNFDGPQLAYKTAAGQFILIDRTQPLPANVKTDAGQLLAAAAQAAAAQGNTMGGNTAQVKKTLAYTTGHQLVFVMHVYTFLSDGETKGWTWTSSALGGATQFGDAASAVAATQAAVGAGAEIIVSQ